MIKNNHPRYALVIILFLYSCGNSNECVILLHGLARTSKSFNKFEKALASKGYAVFNIDYESRRFSIHELADKALIPVLTNTLKYEKVHFVTHSMGGILVREYISHRKIV